MQHGAGPKLIDKFGPRMKKKKKEKEEKRRDYENYIGP